MFQKVRLGKNLIPFEQRNIIPIVGENVHKMGASTGLTVGTFSSPCIDFQCPTDRRIFRNCVLVKWDEGFNYAFHGDSGSLYCVRRGDTFVPIGIHRISDSDEGFSSGCKFSDAFEIFNIDDTLFLNPPYWRA